MPLLSMFMWGKRRTSLLIAGLMIGIIAVIDAHITAEIPLGFLYLVPMAVVRRLPDSLGNRRSSRDLRLAGRVVRCIFLGT